MTYATLIQPILWLLTGGTAAVFVAIALNRVRKRTSPKRPLLYAWAAFVAAILIVPAIAVVPAGNRGVVYRWSGGVDPRERGEGVTLIVPWIQHLTTSSVRTQRFYSSKVYSQSRDLQEITFVGSVNYHVDPTQAAELYQKVGPLYASTVIQPAFFGLVKAAIGQKRAINIAVNRQILAGAIVGDLRAQMSPYGIVVEYVNVEDTIFDHDFVRAVKNKIIAKQKAQEQFNLIAARRAQKQQTIINAQADARAVLIKARAQAQANRKIAASVTDVLLRWQYLVTWDGVLPTTLVGSGQNPSLFLNIP